MDHETWASIRKGRGLSQVRVAEYLGLTRLMVIRIEQGLFQEPPHVEALAELYGRSEAELLLVYHQHVQDTRDKFKREHVPFRRVLGQYSGMGHPLLFYRQVERLSQIGFCKGLCIHPDPIRDYELNEQRGTPKQLIIACNAIGWDYGPLENAVTEWRLSGRADLGKSA